MINQKTYPVEYYALQNNYRCPKGLVHLSNYFLTQYFKGQKESIPKNETSKSCLSSKKFYNIETQNQFIADEIYRLLNEEKVEPKNIVVLARTNNSLRLLESYLLIKSIPYRLKLKNTLAVQKDLQYLTSFIRCILFPKESLVSDIIEVLSRLPGVGPVTLKELKSKYHNETTNITEFLDTTLITTQKVYRIVQQLQLTRYFSLYPRLNLLDIINDYFNEYEIFTPKSRELYLAAIRELLSRIDNEYLFNSYDQTKEDFIVSKLYSINNELAEAEDKVLLTTIHGSKGLEWDYVFYVDVLPRVPHKTTQRFEDACLFYVAVTRAKTKLYITCTETYYDFITKNTRNTSPSEYLSVYHEGAKHIK